MNILEKIINSKRREVDEKLKIIPIERLQDSQRLYEIRDFKKSLKNDRLDIFERLSKNIREWGIL